MLVFRESAKEIDGFLESLLVASDVDCQHYARAALRRRFLNWRQEEGVENLEDLRERVGSDPLLRERWLSALSVHPISMFREPGFLRVFRCEVVPFLRTFPSINIWHMGCGGGEQVYALAIALREEGIYERSRIYATDSFDSVVARAKRGIYPLEHWTSQSDLYLESGGHAALSNYYSVEDGFGFAHPALRDRIVFAQHNLSTDASFNEFQLIICRDVLIYFNRRLHTRVLNLVDNSLCRFGVLGLGFGESLRLHPRRDQYEEISTAARFFRRVGL